MYINRDPYIVNIRKHTNIFHYAATEATTSPPLGAINRYTRWGSNIIYKPNVVGTNKNLLDLDLQWWHWAHGWSSSWSPPCPVTLLVSSSESLLLPQAREEKQMLKLRLIELQTHALTSWHFDSTACLCSISEATCSFRRSSSFSLCETERAQAIHVVSGQSAYS